MPYGRRLGTTPHARSALIKPALFCRCWSRFGRKAEGRLAKGRREAREKARRLLFDIQYVHARMRETAISGKHSRIYLYGPLPPHRFMPPTPSFATDREADGPPSDDAPTAGLSMRPDAINRGRGR
jgi:hypothetical protein